MVAQKQAVNKRHQSRGDRTRGVEHSIVKRGYRAYELVGRRQDQLVGLDDLLPADVAHVDDDAIVDREVDE